jgi:hypothetical protein
VSQSLEQQRQTRPPFKPPSPPIGEVDVVQTHKEGEAKERATAIGTETEMQTAATSAFQTTLTLTDKILHNIPLDLGDKCPILKNLTSLCWIH